MCLSPLHSVLSSSDQSNQSSYYYCFAFPSPYSTDVIYSDTDAMVGNSIREFTTPSFPVYMYDVDGNYVVKTIEEVWICTFFLYIYTSVYMYVCTNTDMHQLLPDSFGPDDLPPSS